jgi:ribonucleoside-diphosphate reductase alpha chain
MSTDTPSPDTQDRAATATDLLDDITTEFDTLDAFIHSDALAAAIDDPDQLTALRDTPPDTDREITSRPPVLHGGTQRLDTGYGNLYVTINHDPDTGDPFELFANIGNSGGFTASFTEALAKTVSTALRAGIDPEELATELQGIRSPTVARDNGDQIHSIPDAVGTALHRTLTNDIEATSPDQATLQDPPDEESPPSEPPSESPPPSQPEPTADGSPAIDPNDDASHPTTQPVIDDGDAPECPDCGHLTLSYTEGCKTCGTCGWSKC